MARIKIQIILSVKVSSCMPLTPNYFRLELVGNEWGGTVACFDSRVRCSAYETSMVSCSVGKVSVTS